MLEFLGPTAFVAVLSYIQYTSADSQSISPANNEANFIPISSRNYGNTAESTNSYYATYPGYPTYGSPSASAVFTDQYNPSDYPNYYAGSTDPKKKPGPPTAYPSYPFYPSPGVFVSPECHEQMMSGVIGDMLQTGGLANFGLLKSVVAAVVAGLLAKIPVILAIKAFLLKLILVPLGLFLLALPILLPMALLFTPLWTRIKEAFTGAATPAPTVVVMMGNATNATTPAKGRELGHGRDLLAALLQSDRCFEKLACLVGARDTHSPLVKPVSWLLKFFQTFKFVQNNMEIRSTLKRYREAYLQGVIEGRKWSSSDSTNEEHVCSGKIYPCDMTQLYSRPEFTSYRGYS